jgi:hypothetical protein
MIPPPRKPATDRIQINRTFDSIDEMNVWVKTNHPKSVIVKTWNRSVICCEVEIPQYNKEKK